MKIIFSLLSLLFASAFVGWSAVLYSSATDWNVSEHKSLSDIGWYASGGRSDFYSIVNQDGTPANSSNNRRAGLSNGSDTSGTLNDYLYVQNYNTTTVNFDYFVHTAGGSNFVPFTPNSYTALSASWLINRDGFATGGGYYVAVQVGGIWYASTTNAAGQTDLGTVGIDLLGSEWVKITEVQTPGNGGKLILESTTSTYSQLFGADQQITGVGFYVDNMNALGSGQFQTLRIDNFIIQDVLIPEPATSLSGAIAAGFFLLRRRR